MVCPKLNKGNCNLLKDKCKQKYSIKMIDYKSCKVYLKNQTCLKRKTNQRKNNL